MSDEIPITETVALWRCIGCGAMGSSEACTGSCQYEPLAVVGVMEHATMLEAIEQGTEIVERLTELVKAVADVPPNVQDASAIYRTLQQEARRCIRAIPAAAEKCPADTAERTSVWLCHSCGQIEAPQQCVGVCIRRTEEFVRASDHERVADRVAELWKRMEDLRRLATRLSWVVPREGQWERTLETFQREALHLLSRA